VNSFSFTPDAAASAEFVPAGVLAKTEDEFPDLEDAFAPAKKSKKNEKKKVVKPTGPSEEDLKTYHKGKPSSFFVLTNDTPNEDQMGFVFLHYPEYGGETNWEPFFTALF
jgi:hypothetical protein